MLFSWTSGLLILYHTVSLTVVLSTCLYNIFCTYRYHVSSNSMFSKSEQYYFSSCRCILHFSFDSITTFSYTICGHNSVSSHDTPHPIVSYVTLIRMTGIPSTSKKETLNDANYDEWHVRVMLNIGRLPLVTQWIMGKRPDFTEEPLFVPQWRDEDRREPVVHGEAKVGGLRGQQVRLVSPRFHPTQLEGICLGLMTEHLQ